MDPAALAAYGWGDRWVALLAEHPDCTPARVVRHDGSALLLATPDGVVAAPFDRGLDPTPAVGDWLACAGGRPVAVLPRSSFLRRRAAGSDTEQAIAANVDAVLLVCGLDRPVKPGRVQRGTVLAWDAGAEPIVVLTKAAAAGDDDEVDVDAEVAAVEEACPGIDVLVTSVLEGIGLEELRAATGGRTDTMLGESGAGKSSLVNALVGTDAVATQSVRNDGKGRHTTSARELHPLPGGGVLIDTPGTRELGLWVDPDAVAATFTDIDDLAPGCRFRNCRHDAEPGCAVRQAVDAGELAPERLDAWHSLQREAEAAALRAQPQELRRANRRFGRIAKEAKEAAQDKRR